MSQDEFDRSLDRWFETEARLTAPADLLDRALAATARQRPRSRLIATLGSHWVGGSVRTVPGTATLAGMRASVALLLLTLLLLLAIAAGAALVGAPSLPPRPSDLGIFAPVAGWIAFEDDGGIWGVDPAAPTDPAEQVLVTAESGIPLGWSRDGRKLLIIRGSAPGAHLFILHADGSEVQATEQPMSIGGATISPDGSRVAFTGATSTSRSALYVVDTLGGVVQKLRSQEGMRAPTFSPDGTQIAYTVGAGDHSHHVWVIDADGSGAHEILYNERTAAAGHVMGLAWSPSGDRIALGLEGSIYTFAPDGSGFTQIAGGDTSCDPSDPCSVKLPKSADSPYWSPDGSRIAYTTGCIEGAGAGDRRGCHLAIADADGSHARSIRSASSGPWHPAPIAPEERVSLPSDVVPTAP